MNDSVVVDLRGAKINVEEAVLGNLLKDESIAREYTLKIRKEYFENADRRKIFLLFQEQIFNGKSLDIYVIASEMEKNKMGSLADCTYLLFTYMESAVTSAYIEEDIELLRKEALRRQLIKLSNELVKDSSDRTLEPDGLVEKYLDDLQNIQAKRPWEQDFKVQRDVAESALKQRQDRLAQKTSHGVTGIPTGIAPLDQISGGWQAGELIVIGGQNGEGKSWFMILHLMAAAMSGAQCLVYSLEMSSEDLYAREVMMSTDINGHEWYQGASTAEKEAQLEKVGNTLDYLPILYMDNVDYDINRLCAMAREQRQKGRCDILFIDYAQIINAMEGLRPEKRVDVIASITRKLKNLAKQLQIPVVVLAQLSRNQLTHDKGKPQKSDLRESGTLEQDADRVFLIYHPRQNGVLEYGKQNLNTKNLIVYIDDKDRRFGKREYFIEHNKDFTHFRALDITE